MLKRIAMMLLAVTAIAVAQEKAPPPTPPSGAVYRMEYTITEMEGTKKVSSRTYVLLVEDHKTGRTRIGNKVPLATKEGAIQYFDISTNIDARPNSVDATSLRLVTTVEIGSVVVQEAATARAPVTRFCQNNIETIIGLDRPTLLATQDEPGTNTTIQVQVLAKVVK